MNRIYTFTRCLGIVMVVVLAAMLGIVLSATPVVAIPLWTPSNTTTIAWYDASDASTVFTNVSGVVTKWANLSTNTVATSSGDQLAPDMTGGSGPTTGSRTVNGLNVLDFNGAQSLMAGYGDNAIWITSGEFSLFMVTAIDDADNANDPIFSFHRETGNWCEFSAKDTVFAGQVTAGGIGIASPLNLTGGPYEGSTNIFSMVFNQTAGNFSAYVGGTSRASGGGYNGAGFRHYYTYYGWKNAQYTDGAVGEVVITTDVSSEARQRMEAYLAWKWGLQGNLPADHPWKNSAPLVTPDTPTGLTAVSGGGSGSVLLSWSAASNATGYLVKRSYTNSGYTVVGSTTNTSYIDYSLKFLTNYYYVISATNQPYFPSADSVPVMIRLPVPGMVITIR